MSYEDTFKQFLKNTADQSEDSKSNNKMKLMEVRTPKNKINEENREVVKQTGNIDKHSSDEGDNSDKSLREKPFTPRQWSKNQTQKPCLFDPDRTSIASHAYTYLDMPDKCTKSLDIVYHSPVYPLPIPTNAKYQRYSLEERSKLLSDYQGKIIRAQMEIAKKSLFRAPYSKPILLTATTEDRFEDFLEDHTPLQDLYVSRSGRQIKRKVYTEMDVDSEPDGDFVNAVKRNKCVENSVTKITLDTPFIDENRDIDNSKNKTNNKKETPRRLKKLSRSETMFDTLIQEGSKKKQQEEQVLKFERKLPELDELDEDTLLRDDNDENIIRRVLPSIGKKAGRPKKQNAQGLHTTNSRTSPLRQYINKSQKTPENLVDSQEKRDCPICGKSLFQSEIEDHAANCEDIEDFEELAVDQFKSGSTLNFAAAVKNNSTTDNTKNLTQEKKIDLIEIDEDDFLRGDNVVRKRVVPPIPGKKGFQMKKQNSQQDFDKIEVISATSLKPNINSLSASKTYKPIEKRDCPICGKEFLQSEIEDHAATCEFMDFDGNSSDTIDESKVMTCYLCNKKFGENTSYEVHVKHCIAQKTMNL